MIDNQNKLLTIKKRSQILQAKKYTLSVSNQYFIIKYAPCTCKCVLIVNTKRNCKTSVKRNKLKRRLKEILKPMNFAYSLVIYSKANAFNALFQEIKLSLENILKKISLK